MRKRLLSAALLLGVVWACHDEAADQPCTGIPAGGCPLSRGVACEDPTCEAVYACRPGNVWELESRCPAREAGVKTDAGADVSDASDLARDAAIDAPPGAYGGPGCTALQAPDCSLGTALSCGAADCCGCEDLFICQNGGWTVYGTCKNGQISSP